MAYQGFHKTVRVTVGSTSWTVRIDNLEIRAFPYSGVGDIAVRLFDGRVKTRIDGWKIRAQFDWPEFDLSDHEQWEEILVELESNDWVCTLDFDYDDKPGQRTGTFTLENAADIIHAIFRNNGHVRPASIAFIQTEVLASVPRWLIGDTQSFVPTHIYYSTEDGVARVPIAGGSETVIFNGGTDTWNIAIDKVSGSDIYVFNDSGQIIRMDRDGSNATIIASVGGNPARGLAVDTEAGYIFYSVNGATVSRMDLDGSNQTNLATGVEHFGASNDFNPFALDRRNQRIFFVTNPAASDSDIKVVNYDGSGEAVVVNNVTSGALQALTYDPNNDLLFVTLINSIIQVNGDGTGQVVLGGGLASNLSVGVDYDDNTSLVYMAEKDTTNRIRSYGYTSGAVTDVHTDGTNKVNGVALGEDPPEITYYPLVWVENDDVMAMDAEGNVVTLYNPGATPGMRGIATDPDGNIYVAHRSQDKIVKLDSTGAEVDTNLVGTLDDIYGVAWYNNEIYWARRNYDRIDKMADDGSGGITNILTGINNIAYLRIFDDLMYYMEDGDLFVANPDGTGQQELLTSSATGGGGAVADGKAVMAEWGATEIRNGDVAGAPDANVADIVEFVNDPNQVIALSNGRFVATDNGGGRIIAFDPDGSNQQVLYRTTNPLRGIAERVYPS